MGRRQDEAGPKRDIRWKTWRRRRELEQRTRTKHDHEEEEHDADEEHKQEAEPESRRSFCGRLVREDLLRYFCPSCFYLLRPRHPPPVVGNNAPPPPSTTFSRTSPSPRHTSFIFLLPFLGRRPAVRRKPLNPGAGPAASPCPCRRPSVGNRRLYALTPLPPTLPRSTPGSTPAPTDDPVICGVFLRAAFKNIVFYSVSWPSAATDFILATFKNRGFYVVLGSREGKKSDKLAS